MYPYSDSSPFYELGVAVTLLMGFGFIALTPVRHSCELDRAPAGERSPTVGTIFVDDHSVS